MLIAVISDTHDNIWNFDKLVNELRRKEVEVLIHCGDYCAPFMFLKLDEIEIPVHGVFGNVDGDRYLMTNFAFSKLKNMNLYGDLGEIIFEKRKICFIHDPKMAKALFTTGEYDLVFHGHTHIPEIRKEGKGILACPGEIMGMKGDPTYLLYDTRTNDLQLIKLGKG